LVFAACLLSAGSLADSLGARRVFVTGVVVFTVASVGCAVAPSMGYLGASRLVQGFGAALMLPSALTLMTTGVDHDRTVGRLVGLYAAAGGIGLAFGPLAGGLAIAGSGWRTIFWINVGVGVIAAVAGLWRGPVGKRQSGRIDFLGQLVAVVAIGGLVFGLVEAPTRGWMDPLVVAALAVFAVAVAALVLVERSATVPLLPLSLYRNRRFLGAVSLGLLFNLMFYGVLFALSLFFQNGLGFGPLAAGLSFLPFTGLVAAGNLTAPRVAERWGRRRVLLIGQGLVAGSLLLVAASSLVESVESVPLALVSLLPGGFGSGLLVPSMTSQALSIVPPRNHGSATAGFNTFRQLGGAVGVALFGPLVAGVADVRSGFVICLIIGAGAMALSIVLSIVTQRPARTAT
jgi:DHA2 family methylenomycin A resistance protein-like MFS transporter